MGLWNESVWAVHSDLACSSLSTFHQGVHYSGGGEAISCENEHETLAHYSDFVKETEPALGDQSSLKLCVKYSCTRVLTSWGRGSTVFRTSQGSTICQKIESLTCFLNSGLLEMTF